MIKLKAIAECSIRLEKGHVDGSSEILFGILAHLIVERGRSVPRSTLAEYFWWNSEPREAGHCLRQSVYKLRQMGAPIETTREHYLLGERAALADFVCALPHLAGTDAREGGPLDPRRPRSRVRRRPPPEQLGRGSQARAAVPRARPAQRGSDADARRVHRPPRRQARSAADDRRLHRGDGRDVRRPAAAGLAAAQPDLGADLIPASIGRGKDRAG